MASLIGWKKRACNCCMFSHTASEKASVHRQTFFGDKKSLLLVTKRVHFRKSLIPVMFSGSVIGQHLLNNSVCALNFNIKEFTVFSLGHSFFHSSALKSLFASNHANQVCATKGVCLQIEILVMIMHFNAFLKHSIIIVQFY